MLSVEELTETQAEQLAKKRQRDANSWGKHTHRVNCKNVLKGEWCYLRRRQEGWTVRELAEVLGVSHVTIIKWERSEGDVERLFDFWQERDGLAS